MIGITLQVVEKRPPGAGNRLPLELRETRLHGLSDVEADVGHLVLGHRPEDRKERRVQELRRALLALGHAAEEVEQRHAVHVVVLAGQHTHLRQQRRARPVLAEHTPQVAQHLGHQRTDLADLVGQPAHGDLREVGVERLRAHELRKRRHDVDHAFAHAPLGVGGEGGHGGQDVAAELLEAESVADLSELADDVETHVRRLVAEQLLDDRQKHARDVLPGQVARQSNDVRCCCGPHVVVLVAAQLVEARVCVGCGDQQVQLPRVGEEGADVRDLVRGSRAHLGFPVLRQLLRKLEDLGGVLRQPGGLGDGLEAVAQHVAHTPARVLRRLVHDGHNVCPDQGGALRQAERRNLLRDVGGLLHDKQTHAVLLVHAQFAVQRQHGGEDGGLAHRLHQLRHVLRGRPLHHRLLDPAQVREVADQPLLRVRRPQARVQVGDERGGAGLAGGPVVRHHPRHHRLEVAVDHLVGQVRHDRDDRLHRLVPHRRFLHAHQVLQRRQQRLRELRTAHVLQEVRELRRQLDQNLVVVVPAAALLRQVRDQLVARALEAKCLRDHLQLLRRLHAHSHLRVFQLIDEHRHREQAVPTVGHGCRTDHEGNGAGGGGHNEVQIL
eukprot:Rhum_TRINITY_DN5171_c0_g1::Rhum_TRINITY_DN5171_c0_g1_i1::g.16721::m.16721